MKYQKWDMVILSKTPHWNTRYPFLVGEYAEKGEPVKIHWVWENNKGIAESYDIRINWQNYALFPDEIDHIVENTSLFI